MVATKNRIGNRQFWIKSGDYGFIIEGSVWIPCLNDGQTKVLYWIIVRALVKIWVQNAYNLSYLIIETQVTKYTHTWLLNIGK